MATIEHIKQLTKAHYERSDERFRTIILQIAASEAKSGHTTQARELADMLEKSSKGKIVKFNDSNTAILASVPNAKLCDLVVSSTLEERISNILLEYRQREKLRMYGLNNRHKILLEGPSGTGKTMTASVIACELDLPLFMIQMDKLVSKFMGETGLKLRQIFDAIDQTTGVYLFDEFDAIGTDRTFDNEVGEMRRVLNTFLQMLEFNDSDSIIIAATNNMKMLDSALFRRFDDVLHYSLPGHDEIKKLLRIKLGSYFGSVQIDNDIIDIIEGLSHSEISRICNDLVKESILSNHPFSNSQLRKFIKQRSGVYQGKEA